MKVNIAIAGGSCTGKSTLAAALFSKLKLGGLDYDLVQEEYRRLRPEFGPFRSPFERLYMWRQQEREEVRSNARDGFVTDWPLFHFYVGARQYESEPRDKLAIRELFRMWLEMEGRYKLVVIAKNPSEIPYKKDKSRTSPKAKSLERHQLITNFVQLFYPDRVLFVKGSVDDRVAQVVRRLSKLGKRLKRRR